MTHRSSVPRARFAPFVRVIAAGMLFIAMPGAQEALEDAVHFLADGHTAHDPDHADEQPEHCCSGLFHVCACHAHAVAALAAASDPIRAHQGEPAALGDQDAIVLPGFHTPPFRPPLRLA